MQVIHRQGEQCDNREETHRGPCLWLQTAERKLGALIACECGTSASVSAKPPPYDFAAHVVITSRSNAICPFYTQTVLWHSCRDGTISSL